MKGKINDAIKKLLESGKAQKHGTYAQTGIVCVALKKMWGTAGIDVNWAYVSPDEIEVVTSKNVHYGCGYLTDRGTIMDTSNRSEFEIV